MTANLGKSNLGMPIKIITYKVRRPGGTSSRSTDTSNVIPHIDTASCGKSQHTHPSRLITEYYGNPHIWPAFREIDIRKLLVSYPPYAT